MNNFVIGLLIATCFVGAISSHEKSESKTPSDLPVLTKGQALVVKGENSKIYVNGKIVYDEDNKLKEGKLEIELSKRHNVKVNGKKVLTQNPSQLTITKNPKLHAKNVTYFEMKIDEQGQVTYTLKTSE